VESVIHEFSNSTVVFVEVVVMVVKELLMVGGQALLATERGLPWTGGEKERARRKRCLLRRERLWPRNLRSNGYTAWQSKVIGHCSCVCIVAREEVGYEEVDIKFSEVSSVCVDYK